MGCPSKVTLVRKMPQMTWDNPEAEFQGVSFSVSGVSVGKTAGRHDEIKALGVIFP